MRTDGILDDGVVVRHFGGVDGLQEGPRGPAPLRSRTRTDTRPQKKVKGTWHRYRDMHWHRNTHTSHTIPYSFIHSLSIALTEREREKRDGSIRVEFGLVEDVAQELVQLPHFGLRRDRFQRRLACARSNTMHSATVVLSIERDGELKKKK
jgi:hypothetical protein